MLEASIPDPSSRSDRADRVESAETNVGDRYHSHLSENILTMYDQH